MALEHIEMRAKNIRGRRAELGLTQEEVADRMHDAKRRRDPDGEPDKTTGQMISDYERAVNDPSPPKLELLAEALETTVAKLSARPADKGETPDLMASLTPGGEAGELREAVDGLRSRIEETYELLRKIRLHQLEGEIEDAAEAEREAEALRSQQPPQTLGAIGN